MDASGLNLGFSNLASWTMRASLLLSLLLGACTTSSCTEPAPPPGTTAVTIKGRTFFLTPALDPGSREKGLGEVTEIPPDGGMIFVFTNTVPRHFVMRDCPIPIDVAFLSEAGTVLQWHAMVPEEPRREGEDQQTYDRRLKHYPSGFPARFAVEVAGGTFGELGLQPGDQIKFDIAGLKARAR